VRAALGLFGKLLVARYPTLEQAGWRARKLGEERRRDHLIAALFHAIRRPFLEP
jgi:hypothetical protein